MKLYEVLMKMDKPFNSNSFLSHVRYPSQFDGFTVCNQEYSFSYDTGKSAVVAYPNFGCYGKEGFVEIYDTHGDWRWCERYEAFDSKSPVTFPITFLYTCRYAECVYGVRK